MAALAARFFAAFGPYGAEQRTLLLDVQKKPPFDAIASFRKTLRTKDHTGSFFRETFVTDYVRGRTL